MYKEKLFFGDFFAIVLEAYIELLISGFLNIEGAQSAKMGEVISRYTTYVILVIVLVIVPASLFYVLK